jgi:hypothetical protein
MIIINNEGILEILKNGVKQKQAFSKTKSSLA